MTVIVPINSLDPTFVHAIIKRPEIKHDAPSSRGILPHCRLRLQAGFGEPINNDVTLTRLHLEFKHFSGFHMVFPVLYEPGSVEVDWFSTTNRH